VLNKAIVVMVELLADMVNRLFLIKPDETAKPVRLFLSPSVPEREMHVREDQTVLVVVLFLDVRIVLASISHGEAADANCPA